MSTVRLVCIDDDASARLAALEALAAMVEPYNVGGPPIAERCERAAIFRVEQGGELIGYYALEARQVPGGQVEGFIVAAAGVRNVGAAAMTRRVLPLIERQFIDAAAVAFATRRRSLMREAVRQGYAAVETLPVGTLMRKDIGVRHALRAP